jgi:RHS repeat-associated protein
MNWTKLNGYGGFLATVVALVLVQNVLVPEAGEAVRKSRSEVTLESILGRGLVESGTDDLGEDFSAREIVPSPETRPSSDGEATAQVGGERRPATAVVPAPPPVGRNPWPWWWLWLLRADDTRMTSTAAASEGQTGPDNEKVTALDPVNPKTGEMLLKFPLVKVAGPGLDFSFVLSYRSDYSYDGPMGNRWEHNWNARFQYNAGATRLDRMADNRVDTYAHSGSGVYASPAGFNNEKLVTKYHDGALSRVERRLRDGTLEVYKQIDAANYADWYFLTDVKHRDADNAISLTYDTYKKLSIITDTRGEQFKLTYDSNARISTLEDRSGGSARRTWTFTYSGSDLVTVAAPGSRNTAFTYASTSLLSTIRAPREYPSGTPYLSNSYSGTKVQYQTLGNGTFTMAYSGSTSTETDREGAKRIFQWNGSGLFTKIRREVTSGTYADTVIEWNGDIQPTKLTYPEGNGVQFKYSGNVLIASVRCNSSGLSMSTSDIDAMRASSNCLVTEYTYQSATNWNMVTKVKDAVGSEWGLARDSDGNVTAYTTPQHSSDPYVIAYDSNSRVSLIDDPVGRRVGFIYSTRGTLSKVTLDPAGGAFATTYVRDLGENVITVTDAENRATAYSRDVMGLVQSVTTHGGGVTDYFYDLNDAVTETRQDVGISGLNAERTIIYSRNIMDLVTQAVELSKTMSYSYDKNDRLTLLTPPNGKRVVKHVFDLGGREITRSTAYSTGAQADEAMTYDGNNRLITRTDGINGNATVSAYDGFDRLITMTDPESHYRTVAYDKNNNVLTRESYNSSTSKLAADVMAYDLNNRMVTSSRWAVDAGGSNLGASAWMDTILTYDKSGKLVTKADPCGCGGSTNTISLYDAAGRLTKTKDAATNEVIYDLDKTGLVTKLTRSEKESGTVNYVVDYGYNSDKHMISVGDKGTTSVAHTTTYNVDKMGRTTKVIDPNGNNVFYDYDDLGRVTRTRIGGAGGYITKSTAYDLSDNVVTETNGLGNYSIYVYDDADRLNIMKDESNQAVQTNTYDDAHNVTSRTDGNGTVAARSYDGRNLLTKIDYTLAANVVGPTLVKFTYDGLGRVVTAVSKRADTVEGSKWESRVKRAWNTLSRLESEETWIAPTSEGGGGDPSRTITYTYDGSGRVITKTYQDGTQVKLGYDSLNRVNTMMRKDPGGAFTSTAGWTFIGPSRMSTMQFGNGVKETMSYDQWGRASELWYDRPNTSTSRVTMAYFKRLYDDGNRVTRERRDYHNNAGTVLSGARDFGDIYGYDDQNRLVTAVRGVGVGTVNHALVESAAISTSDYSTRARYTLDAAGNRQTLTLDNSGGTATHREDHAYDSENQLTTRTVWDYHVPGASLSQTSTTTVTYDTNGNHISANPTVKVDAQNRIYESGNWRYRYDPFGRRIEKREVGGSTWRHFYYDGVVCVVEWHTTLVSSVPTESAYTKWVRIFGPYLVDQLIWAKTDPCGTCGSYATGYAHVDYLGSAVMATQEAANGAGGVDIFETYRYDEYGKPDFFDASGGSLGGASLIDNTYLYTGREWDSEIAGGRYYYRARYYDQTSGRFLSRDPRHPDAELNFYSYVDSLPTGAIDPMGRVKEMVDSGFTISVGDSAAGLLPRQFVGVGSDDNQAISFMGLASCGCAGCHGSCNGDRVPIEIEYSNDLNDLIGPTEEQALELIADGCDFAKEGGCPSGCYCEGQCEAHWTSISEEPVFIGISAVPATATQEVPVPGGVIEVEIGFMMPVALFQLDVVITGWVQFQGTCVPLPVCDAR